MRVSRRAFVRRVGSGGIAAVGGLALAARGSEAATGWLARGRQASAPARGALIRLDSNENPLGPPAPVLDAIKAAFVDAGRYPNRAGRSLVDDLGRMHGVTAEHVALGAGSAEILRMAVDAFTTPTRGLVAGLPTFETCTGRARQLGRPVFEVPVDGSLQLDLDGMGARAREAGLVFLCNPNNPTGALHGGKAVRDFVGRVLQSSPDAFILIDEAYHDYVDDPSYESAIALALDEPRVFVSRTFSKAFGMAGIRLGYAVGRPETMRRLSEWRLGNGISILALHAGRAALAARGGLAAERTRNRAALDYTAKALADLGFKVAPSQANFLLADVRRPSREVAEACRQRGVAIGRPFPPLDTWARISIGTMDEMRSAVGVLKQVLGAVPSAAAL